MMSHSLAKKMQPTDKTRPFDAILFDLGNTLIYFDGKVPEVYEQSDAVMLQQLREAGFDPGGVPFLREFRARLDSYQEERDNEFIEYTTIYILRTLLDEWGLSHVPNKALKSAIAARYAVSQAYWHAEEDAFATLRELIAQGCRLAIISNAGDDDDVQALVDRAELRPYFDLIVSSAAMGIRKPNPRIFHLVLERLKVPPERAVMVGDSLGADILGARNAGLYAIWIKRRADTAANRSHLDTIQPDASIDSLSELPAVLLRLSARSQQS
jgi:2-haloalkanoic acid dehalogenase type II